LPQAKVYLKKKEKAVNYAVLYTGHHLGKWRTKKTGVETTQVNYCRRQKCILKKKGRSKLRGELTFYILAAILENGGLKKSASKRRKLIIAAGKSVFGKRRRKK
jgi:hypothetical protein